MSSAEPSRSSAVATPAGLVTLIESIIREPVADPRSTRNTTREPFTGAPLASVTCTESGIGSTLPAAALWPFPALATTVNDASTGDVATSRRHDEALEATAAKLAERTAPRRQDEIVKPLDNNALAVRLHAESSLTAMVDNR